MDGQKDAGSECDSCLSGRTLLPATSSAAGDGGGRQDREGEQVAPPKQALLPSDLHSFTLPSRERLRRSRKRPPRCSLCPKRAKRFLDPGQKLSVSGVRP